MCLACLVSVAHAQAPSPASPSPSSPAPSPSPSPSPAPSPADRLFDQARALAKAGRIAEACKLFTKSFEIDHALGTELNLADCEEKQGHLRLAWRLFLAAADESERSDDTKRTEFARGRADALAAQLTELVINVATPTAPGLTITIADHTVEPAPVVRDRTEPGTIKIVATMPDRAPFTTSVTGVAGASITLEIPAFGPPLPKPTVLRRRRSRVRLAVGIGAVGAASGIAATILALKGRSDYNGTSDGPNCARVVGGVVCNDLGDSQLADAQGLADLGTVFAIGSGVALVGAAVLVLTAPKDRIMIMPTAGTDRVGFALQTTF